MAEFRKVINNGYIIIANDGQIGMFDSNGTSVINPLYKSIECVSIDDGRYHRIEHDVTIGDNDAFQVSAKGESIISNLGHTIWDNDARQSVASKESPVGNLGGTFGDDCYPIFYFISRHNS